MRILRPLAVLVFVPFVALACSAEVPPDEADPTEGDDSGESAEALTGAQACSLVAGASAGLAVVASQAFVGTTTCAGALAVTGAGELVCVVPAGATALTAIAAVLTGSASYLLCSASTSGSQRIPLASTGSSTCSTVSATTSPRFCSNLYRRYKNACGSLDLRNPNASETSCTSVSLATARDQSTCTTLQTRIERNAQCLHGRRIMQDFIRRGICQPDPTDPSGTNHEPPIRVANNLLAECKSKMKSLSNLCGKDPEELQRSSVRRFNQAIYTCK